MTGGGEKDSAGYVASNDATFVEYTVTSIPEATTSVNLQLAGPSDVTVGANDVVSFPKATGFNYWDVTSGDTNFAEVGDVAIVSVNGTAAGGTAVDAVPVIDGEVTFRLSVSGANNAGSAVPVVFVPFSSAVNQLAVDADGVATGVFGIGGEATFTPGEFADDNGSTATANVTAVSSNHVVAQITDDGTGNLAVGSSGQFFWKTGDTFQVDSAPSTESAFVAAVSVGDEIKVTNYKPFGAAGTRNVTFNLTADKPAEAPTNVAAALVDTTADGSADTLTITYTAFAGGYAVADAGDVQIRRATVTNGVVGTFGAWVDAGDAAADTATSYASSTSPEGKIELTGAAIPGPGTYVYQVRHTGLISTGPVSEGSASSNELVVSTAAALTSVETSLDSSTFGSSFTDGDSMTFRVAFSGVINDPATAIIELRDGDASPTIYRIDCGGAEVACTQADGGDLTFGGTTYAAERVLKVVITGGGGVSEIQAGTAVGLQFPVTISDSAGITGWDLANSTAKTLG